MSTNPDPEAARRLSLIFDADDTLWHNLILFERVVEDFLDWVTELVDTELANTELVTTPLVDAGPIGDEREADLTVLDRVQIRRLLDDIERVNIATRGYGARAFLDNLAETLEHLQKRPVSDDQLAEIERLAEALIRHDIDLMPGVVEVLIELGARHDLYLLTKGSLEEQRRKVEASGLAGHFRSVHIVPEKDAAVYLAVAEQHGLRPEHTWMIGNSPKSDILPARAAGLNAVYIPHVQTWVLEHSEIDLNDERILTVSSITALLQHF